MKASKYLEELRKKSIADLNEELVVAKRSSSTLDFRMQPISWKHQQNKESEEYCQNSDSDH